MDPSRIARVVASFVGMVALAIVLGLVLNLGFVAAGATSTTATQLSVPVAITVALAVSDAYTPLGRGPIEGLREDPQRLALDLAVAAVIAFVTAGVVVALDTTGPGVPGGDVVSVVGGIVAGYGFFLYRNQTHYRASTTGA